MTSTAAETNQAIAYRLSNNLSRLLREFSRDFERRIWQGIASRGYTDIRPSHSAVLANLGMGAVRVTELAERAQVTQQAMGKMLKELERMQASISWASALRRLAPPSSSNALSFLPMW